jgi:hypothetical protein
MKSSMLRTLSLSVALLGCVVHSATAGAAGRQRAVKHKLEQDFTRAMFADGKIMNAKKKQREDRRKRNLMEKLMEASTPRHLADNYNSNSNSNGEYSFEDSYEWMNPVYQQMMEDGIFDLTARSFKYSGCAAIKAFDPDRAEQNGNPMVVDTYAVFRLCPEDSCNKYSLTGCGKNYGEYVVEMSTYLEFMLEFYESHYGAYCEYCYPCDYTYQVMKRQTQGSCYEEMNQEEYTEKQSMQQMAWEDYYQQNFGDMSEYTQAKAEYQSEMTQQMNSYSNSYSANSNTNYNSGNSNTNYNGSYNNNNGSSSYNGSNRKLEDSSSSSSSSSGYYSQFTGGKFKMSKSNEYGNLFIPFFSLSLSLSLLYRERLF